LTSGSDAVDTPFGRDSDGLLTKVGPFAIKRDGPAGAPTELGDGTLTTAYLYDSLGRLEQRTHTVIADQDYKLKLSRDNVGRITKKKETVAGEEHSYDYTYDSDGQLTRVDRDGDAAERYAYDDNGNRTSRQSGEDPIEPSTYDGQDRLTKRAAVDYEFDSDGFLRKRGLDAFRYSGEGELLEAEVTGGTVMYAYDGHRRRVSRTDDSGTTQYLYGNPDELFQVTGVRFPSGQLSTFYYDEEGLLVALQRGSDRYYVAADLVGTPRVVTDAGGSVVKTFEYDSFGSKVSENGDASFRLPIGFAGGLVDEVTGLVRFGFRDYDPEAGRWTARDPVLFAGGQGNLYAYAGDDPINNRDPSGLDPDLILNLPDGPVLGTYRPGSPAWYAGDNIWIPARAEGWILSDGSFLPFDPSLKTETATKLDVIMEQLKAVPGKVSGACIRVLSGSDAKFGETPAYGGARG
jgi:RHS repeat-associated protein